MRRRVGPRSRSKIELNNDASRSALLGSLTTTYSLIACVGVREGDVETDRFLTYLLRAQRFDWIDQTGAARRK